MTEAAATDHHLPADPAAVAPERDLMSKFDPLIAERQALMHELAEVEQAWAGAMKNGVPADSRALDPLLHRHRAWVAAMWDKPYPPAAYGGLADLHLGHPDFVSRYEAIAEGFSDYHAAAMKAYAARLGA